MSLIDKPNMPAMGSFRNRAEINISDAPNITLKEDTSRETVRHNFEFRLPGAEWMHQGMPAEWLEFFHAQKALHIDSREKSMLDGERYTTTFNDLRYRCQMTNNRKGWTIAMRKINLIRMGFRELKIDPEHTQKKIRPTGLHIIGGKNGHGKTATLMALFDSLENRGKTLDIGDPIEYIIDEPFVDQRQVGEDVSSMAVALFEGVRGYYDTVIIGEIRDPETAKEAILAGQSGALVLATLHAESVRSCIGRMENFLSAEYKALLPHVLSFCMVQYLYPVKSAAAAHGKTLIPVYETLSMTPDLVNKLSDGSDSLQNFQILQEQQQAMTFDKCLNMHRRNQNMDEEEYNRALQYFSPIAS